MRRVTYEKFFDGMLHPVSVHPSMRIHIPLTNTKYLPGLFAGMFPEIKNHLLVRKPTLLRNLVVTSCVVHVFVMYLCFFVLPLAARGIPDQALKTTALTVLALVIATFTAANFAVCSVLIKLFQVSVYM
jgi:hypothetical protein